MKTQLPDVIYANEDRDGRTWSAFGDDCTTIYHHDDKVRELREALSLLTQCCEPFSTYGIGSTGEILLLQRALTKASNLLK